MSDILEYIYAGIIAHLILVAAIVARAFTSVYPIYIDDENQILYKSMFFYCKNIFLYLFTIVGIYWVGVNHLAGWKIDTWELEFSLVTVTFIFGHVVFIIYRNSPEYLEPIFKFRKYYIATTVLYLLSFYIRIILSVGSTFSYNPQNIAYFFPDRRHNDLYLLNNYYMSYSEYKNIVIEKKFFLFRKDIANVRTIRDAICAIQIDDFTENYDRPILVPFPYYKRLGDSVVVFTNSNKTRSNGQIHFHVDGNGRLQITGYSYKSSVYSNKRYYTRCGSIYLN